MKKASVLLILLALISIFSCKGRDELTIEEIEALQARQENPLLALTETRTKPEAGDAPYDIGVAGGTWTGSINNDPKTFNPLTARDGDSWDIIEVLYDGLTDYDPISKEFLPRLATSRIEVFEGEQRMDVHFTLRDDIFWTTPASEDKIQVTADDIIFWYDEIEGDPLLQMPGYPGQFVTMEDGSQQRITIEKTGELTFVFHFPRPVANPLLMTQMTFGPRYIFEPVKQEQGVEGLLELYSLETDPKTIPSIGPYHISEYTPGVRVVLTRNPDYWRADREGNRLPYIDKRIIRILSDKNTELLVFKNGEKDGYSLRPEDMETLLTPEDRDYSVINGGPALGSQFMCFNQNPDNLDPVKLGWFTQKEFRQAMSCLINRPRIIKQVYRGLADPAHHFFALNNPFYDPDIKLEYTYNPEKAVELLESIGFYRDEQGIMHDSAGNPVEFDLTMGVEYNISIDIGNIFADECKKVGIKVNVKPTDFQKLVDQLMNSYDWQAVMVSLGANSWPEYGSNVWKSNGNFHLWRPLQQSPATQWEADIDRLWNEGAFTPDREKAEPIWEEYQKIILEQLPMIYLVHPYSFYAIRDRWGNVYYDTVNSTDTDFYYSTELAP